MERRLRKAQISERRNLKKEARRTQSPKRTFPRNLKERRIIYRKNNGLEKIDIRNFSF